MKRIKRRLTSVLALAGMLGGMLIPTQSQAYVVDDIVSVKTVNTDVCVAATDNSPYDVEKVKEALDMNSDAVGSSARVNTTVIDATDLSNWYVYDHYNINCYAGSTTEEREQSWLSATNYNKFLRPFYEDLTTAQEFYDSDHVTGVGGAPTTIQELMEKNSDPLNPSTTYPWGYVYNMYEHIAAASDAGKASMNFYGYPNKPFSDFLFYPASSEGKKKVHYTVDARNVKTHSLNSAGFLFNTSVQKKNNYDVLNGYVLLFEYKGATSTQNEIANGMKTAAIYRLTDVPVEAMHRGDYHKSISQVTSFDGTKIGSVDLSNILQFPFDGQYDISDIEMEITPTHVTVTMKKTGSAVADPDYVSPVTIFDQNITDTGAGGFGPLVSYQQHSCSFTSSYQFSDLQMSITSTDSVLDGLSKADYIAKGLDEEAKNLVDSNKFFVLIGNNSQTPQGYLDYFDLQNDAILLEKLKKQEIILVTNLNIQPPNQQINGTNYKLADYLGEDNVIQIPDDTMANMAANIKQIMENNTYNKQQAKNAQNALQDVIADGQAAAACQVLYKDYQVESVDLNHVPSTGIELKIQPTVEIGVTNPNYQITKPNGDVVNYTSNRFKVYSNSQWPAGMYTATIFYEENVSASTTFYMMNLYDSYLNGEPTSVGKETDGVQARLGDIGPKTVKGGEEYVVYFPKTDAYDIPNIEYVAVDVNGNGTVENVEKLDPSDYTYTTNAQEGVLRISEEKTTGDVYISASQSYSTHAVKWHFLQPAKWEKLDYSYQNKVVRSTDTELNGKVLWEDCRDYYGSPKLKVTVGGTELAEGQYSYNPTTGEFHLPMSYIHGTVEIYVDRPFLNADVEVEVENLTYDGPVEVNGTSDFEAVLEPMRGYALPEEIQLQHKVQNTILPLGAIREYEDYELNSYQYNALTGNVKLPVKNIDGEVKLIANGALCHYDVTTNLHGLTFQGEAKGDVEHEYVGQLVAKDHYLRPFEIEVKRGNEILDSGYSYNPETGEVVIDQGEIYDKITIRAVGEPCQYPVTTTLENVVFTGNSVGDIEHTYHARVHADAHYKLPSTIIIKRDGQVMDSGYTYSEENRSITINKGGITGEIEIEMSAIPIDYSVQANLQNMTYEGAEKGNIAEEYHGVIKPDKYYHLPETITVTRAGTPMNAGYQYNSKTGDFIIEKGKLTGDIVIQAEGVPISYQVVGTMKKATLNGADYGDVAHEYVAQIVPDAHYKAPKTILIKRGNEELTEGYHYDSKTGKVTIERGQITDDIEVIATSDLIDYFVVYHTKYLSYEGANIGDVEHIYEGKIIANEEYELPKDITIKRAGDILKEGYTYDAETGKIVLDAGQITDDIEINAIGAEREYRVDAEIAKGEFLGEKEARATENYEAQIIAKKGYSNPEKIEVLRDGQLLLDGVEYDYTSGKIRILASQIRGNLLIRANMVARSSNVIYDVKNITPEGNVNATTHEEYVAKLTPIAINYILPETIEVSMGQQLLVPDQDYVYNSKAGSLVILQNVIDDTVVVKAEAEKIILKEEEKLPQAAPKEEDLSIIPPTYENSKDGKIIGVSSDMEYSLDGGNTWHSCNKNKITNLGVGTIVLRFKGDETKQAGALAIITLDSETSEYYIPTISMSKKMGCGKKFKIMLLNTDETIVKAESTNPKVATVNQKGLVTSKKKAGKTKVVLTVLKGKHIVQYVMNLTVSKSIKKNYSLTQFKTSYKGPSIVLYKVVYRGANWKIKMTHTKGSKITYRSSNKKVAKVSKSGKVTGISNGVATIKVSVENSKVADQYYVYVRVAKKGEKSKIPGYLKVIK